MDSPLATRLDLIVQRYREAIVTKRLQPGQELDIVREAKRLNAPLPLVRQAFRTLANMGLVSLKPQGRVVIQYNTLQSLQSLEFDLTRRRA
jgi:DNA-binding GntR family transcriptional regulator